jgi:6-phosphogluconolactonase (cycloisomerase 2 family)
MNGLSVCQGNNVRRSHEALSVFAVMLFGVVCLGSAAATVVSRYAYVPGNNGISSYTVNTKTGQLRSNGYFFPGAGLSNATVDPSEKFVYAIEPEANSISAYAINATTGQLTAIAGSYASPAGSTPVSITIDPSDKFLYVVNSDFNGGPNCISAYTLDDDTGALTPVNNSPFATGDGPLSLVIDPTGNFAYVNNVDDSPGGDISGYTINTSTGALTPMTGSPFLSGSGAFALVIAPSGKFGYVLQPSTEITIFSIDPTTGIPKVVGSPFNINGTSFYSMVMTPSGKFIYIPEIDNPGTIAAVKVNTTTGALTAVSGSPFASGNDPYSATVDPGGKLLYVTNAGSDEVWTYKIAGTGALTLLNAVRTPPTSDPVALVTGSAAVTYTPKFAYVANQGSATVAATVSAYTVAKTGHLSAVSGSPFADGGSEVFAYANSVTVDPSGRFAYVANGNANDVAAYTIDAGTGALTAISDSPFGAGTDPTSVTVDPSGRFVYVTNGDSYNVSAFAINSSTGALTQISGSPFPTGTTSAGPVSVTVDPTGQFVYVANGSFNDGSVSAFTIDPVTGVLTAVSGSPYADAADPGSVAVDASGRVLYVANLFAEPDSGEQYETLAFPINPGTGTLTTPPYSSPNLGAGTTSVVTDPLGEFLYSPQNAEGGILSLSFNTSEHKFSIINSPDLCVDNDGPTAMTVDLSGKFVYVANSSTNSVTACTIDQTTGDLNNITGEAAVPAGTNPASVVITGTIQ